MSIFRNHERAEPPGGGVGVIANLWDLERESLVAFLGEQAEHLQGKVLDYGCGDLRYRAIVEAAGGSYYGYDRADFAANVSRQDIGEDRPLDHVWDTILCCQVVQYVENVPALLRRFRRALRYGGVLVITWPTTWPEVEKEDLHRFTQSGMEALLRDAEFRRTESSARAFFTAAGAKFVIGYGAVCWA
jgi:SAM-dependent methyltransferase